DLSRGPGFKPGGILASLVRPSGDSSLPPRARTRPASPMTRNRFDILECIRMRGSGSSSLLPPASRPLLRGLGVGALLALVTMAAISPAQVPVKAVRLETASAEEALALDQSVLAAARKESEIMTNLTWLSDMIGPRLTGSAALKRANQWAAEKM